MQMRPMPEDGSIFQPVHPSNDMQRSVSAERGNAASQQQRMDPQRSGGMVRRPLRTVPLIPLEGASGIPTRKESAQAVWEYAGETDEFVPIAPAASALDGANDDFIQPEMQTGEWLQYKIRGYQHMDEPEVRSAPKRTRRLVRTDNAMQQAEPTAIILPTTTPLNSPYDRLLPSWELRRKRDTIFLMLLTLLVLGILGIMSCNYLLSLYHI
jgi:hypothetical protein